MEKIKGMNKCLLNAFKWAGTLGLAVLLSFGSSVNAYADDETVLLNDLINESHDYDGKIVHVKGEVLLEALERKGYAWININDGTNAMGVVLPYEEVKKIQLYGDYKTKGDQIEIEAEFHRSCNVHGGDMDLHLVRMISIEKGEKVMREVEPIRVGVSLAVTLTAALSLIYFFKK